MAKGSVQDRTAQYVEMRKAILRHLWAEGNSGLTVKVLAEENGFGEEQVSYQLRTLTRQGLTRSVSQGRQSAKSQDLEGLRTDSPKMRRFFALAAGESPTYIQRPNLWFLTEAGLELFKSEE